MDRMDAIRAAIILWNKWVTRGSSFDLNYLRDCILREARFHGSGKSNASLALQAETRGELVKLGKIRKALA